MYAGLLLDFYGTLVEEDGEAIARIVARVAASSPHAPAVAEVSSWWDRRFAALCAAAHGDAFRTQRSIERESLEMLLRHFESPLDADALSEELFAYWSRPRPHASTEPFLRELELPVCIVSNIDAEDLDAAIASLGWSFEHVVTSESCRAYKPRAELFAAGLAALGCAPDEVLHVGDSLGSDVRGAHAAGIAVAWLNAAGRALPPELAAAPRHVVRDLGELARALRGR